MARLVVALAVLVATSSLAWDTHQNLTRAALAGEKLDDTVEVVPVETFLKRTFGSECTVDRARDAVFDGIGRDFQFFYQSRIHASFRTEWEKGNNILSLHPEQTYSPNDPQRIGSHVAVREVITTFSDEPDWKLDDDVPRLSESNVLAEANSGTATRALRHFWTPDEVFFGVDLGKGQETDQRMQHYYQLAMVAFDAGEDYWGYRFLGNAVHYVQDMAQPYHVLLIINNDMLDLPHAIHRLICDVDRDLGKRFPDAGVTLCRGDETLSAAVIDGAWYVGTYHALFEEFALALLEQNGFSTREIIRKDTTDFAPIRWRLQPEGLLDLKSVIRQAQQQILPRAQETGEETLATFGNGYVHNRNACEATLPIMGKGTSLEYQMGAGYYLVNASGVKNSQFLHRAKLLNLTHALLGAGATWTRQFIRESKAPRSAEARAEIAAFREHLRKRCAAPPAKKQ